ncbi:MAG TPA: hypothetical protein VIY53_04895 [Acidobacteriaceae bacterium]
MRTLLLLAALSSAAFSQQAPQSRPAPAAQSAPAATQALPPTTPPGPTPAARAVAPSAVPAMDATDAYLYAMQPFNNARGAPNDLTDADQWALSIAIARAKEQCELLKTQKLLGEDLLALGKLCILGQDFDPARQALIRYVTLPEAKSPELAHLLLTKAFLGLHDISSAESQMESLLSLFPYDASIHLGTDMVIDSAEDSDDADDLAVAPRLNEQQLPHILDALAHAAQNPASPVPPSLGDAVDIPVIVRDALRIADSLRRSGKPEDAAKILDQLQTAIDVPAILNSASFPVIQAALIRYDLFRQPSPVHALHGAELPATSALPAMRTIPLYDPDPAAHRIVRHINAITTSIRMLDDRTLVLVFSLAGPASDSAIHAILNRLALDRITPGLKVVAVTSIAANVGQEEAPSPAVLASIRAFRAELPAALPVLLVPDAELKPFAIDSWPAALLIDGKGRILWLNTLTGSPGAIHQMERDMESAPPLLPN